MQKKRTITVDERVYDGLCTVVGAGKISRFIEKLVCPHVLDRNRRAAYPKMAGARVAKRMRSIGRSLSSQMWTHETWSGSVELYSTQDEHCGLILAGEYL